MDKATRFPGTKFSTATLRPPDAAPAVPQATRLTFTEWKLRKEPACPSVCGGQWPMMLSFHTAIALRYLLDPAPRGDPEDW